MSMLLEERVAYGEGELLLSAGPLAVGCQLTVEWLRGIAEPTWYGYLVPIQQEMRILPGRYRLLLDNQTLELLVRRPANLGDDICFPFWGLGTPPTISAGDARPLP
jgi:hypothetical protein